MAYTKDVNSRVCNLHGSVCPRVTKCMDPAATRDFPVNLLVESHLQKLDTTARVVPGVLQLPDSQIITEPQIVHKCVFFLSFNLFFKDDISFRRSTPPLLPFQNLHSGKLYPSRRLFSSEVSNFMIKQSLH